MLRKGALLACLLLLCGSLLAAEARELSGEPLRFVLLLLSQPLCRPCCGTQVVPRPPAGGRKLLKQAPNEIAWGATSGGAAGITWSLVGTGSSPANAFKHESPAGRWPPLRPSPL